MIDGLSAREFRRRGRSALKRMTPLQRQVFHALRSDDVTYPELAARHRITDGEVRGAFTAALLVFAAAYDEPPPWWHRMLR